MSCVVSQGVVFCQMDTLGVVAIYAMILATYAAMYFGGKSAGRKEEREAFTDAFEIAAEKAPEGSSNDND